MHKALISTLRPICKPPLRHRISPGHTPLLQAPCSYPQRANFSVFNNAQFRHSQSHEKWLMHPKIQSWWSALKASYWPKQLREVKEVPSKNRSLELSLIPIFQQNLEIRTRPEVKSQPETKTQPKPQTPPEPQNPPEPLATPKSKKASKKKAKPPIQTPALHPLHHPSNPTLKPRSHKNEYFYSRLQQVLCYYYAGVLSGTIPASTSVKHFISTTHFNHAFLVLSQAVLPESKRMISDGLGLGLATSYVGLRRNCLVPKQGCYMNIITTPQRTLGIYIGGAGSLASSSSTLTRPLRGTLADGPVKREGVSCGVGRRVAQHLSDAVRGRNASCAHYRFMERRGNTYDFRLLAVFEEEVDVGAVWLLEAFFVLELGTWRNPKAERNTEGPMYEGLNRASPLITAVRGAKLVKKA